MKKLPIFIATAFLTSFCSDNDTELTRKPINSNIIIETRESLAGDARSLSLHCKTEKNYPCSNFPILTESKTNKNSFHITFTGVGETIVCATALGPATTVVDLKGVPNGDYPIELNNANLKNNGTLRISDKEIKLILLRHNGIEIVRQTTMRVPQRTYWGSIGYHASSSIDLVNEFLQKLTDQGAIFNKQAPGHYVYYEIDHNGEIVTDTENSGYRFLKAFIFQFDGNESALKDLVRIDGKVHKNDLSIRMETFKGERVNNWSE